MSCYRSRREPATDEAMVAQFGKPDYKHAFAKEGHLFIPMGKRGLRLWRIEPLPRSRGNR